MSYVYLPSNARGNDDETTDWDTDNFNSMSSEQLNRKNDLDGDLSLDSSDDDYSSKHHNSLRNPTYTKTNTDDFLDEDLNTIDISPHRIPGGLDQDDESSGGEFGYVTLKTGEKWKLSQSKEFLEDELRRKRRAMLEGMNDRKTPLQLLEDFFGGDHAKPVRASTIENRVLRLSTLIIFLTLLLLCYLVTVMLFPFGTRSFEHTYPHLSGINGNTTDSGLYLSHDKMMQHAVSEKGNPGPVNELFFINSNTFKQYLAPNIDNVDESYLFSALVEPSHHAANEDPQTSMKIQQHDTTPVINGYITACLPPVHSPLHIPAVRALLFIAKRTGREVLLQQQQPAEFLAFSTANNNRNGPKNGLYSAQDWGFYDALKKYYDSQNILNTGNLLKTNIADKKSKEYSIKKNFVAQYHKLYYNQAQQSSSTMYPFFTSTISMAQSYRKSSVLSSNYKASRASGESHGAYTLNTGSHDDASKQFVNFDELYDIKYLNSFGSVDSPSNTPSPSLLETPQYNLFDGECTNVRLHVCLSKHPLSTIQQTGVFFDTCTDVSNVDSHAWCSNCAFHVPNDLPQYTYLRQQNLGAKFTDSANITNEKTSFIEKFMRGEYKYIKRSENKPNNNSLNPDEAETINNSTFIDSIFDITPSPVHTKLQYEPMEIRTMSIKDFEHFIYRDGLNHMHSNTTLKTIHLNSLTLATYAVFLDEQQRLKPNYELKTLTQYYPTFAISIRAEAMAIQQSLVAIVLAKQQRAMDLSKRDWEDFSHNKDEGISPEKPHAFPNNIKPQNFEMLTLEDNSSPVPQQSPNDDPTTTLTPVTATPETHTSIPSPDTSTPAPTPPPTPPPTPETPATPETPIPLPNTATPTPSKEQDDEDPYEDDELTPAEAAALEKLLREWKLRNESKDLYSREDYEDLSSFDYESEDGSFHHAWYNKERNTWEEDTEDAAPTPFSNTTNPVNVQPLPDNKLDNISDEEPQPTPDSNKPTIPNENTEGSAGDDAKIPPPRNKKLNPNTGSTMGNICALVYNIGTKGSQDKLMKKGWDSPQNPLLRVALWALQYNCSAIYVYSHASNPNNDNKYNRQAFANNVNTILIRILNANRQNDGLPELKTREEIKQYLNHIDFMWGCRQFTQCARNKALEYAVSVEIISALPYVLINTNNNMAIVPQGMSLQQEGPSAPRTHVERSLLTYDVFAHHVVSRRVTRGTPGKVTTFEEVPIEILKKE